MKYTKNLRNKLILAGFGFDYEHKDAEIHYEVFKCAEIEITVDHTNRQVGVDLLNPDEALKGIESIEDLNTLHRLIYGKTQQKNINNEEGD